MDKRSLLFVLCVTVSLFIANLYFAHHDRERKQEWYEQQEAGRQQHLEALQRDVAARTEALGNLPVVMVYADEAGEQVLGRGVVVGNSVIVVSGEEVVPAVFADIAGRRQRLELATEGAPPGSPAIYGASVTVATLPELGKVDLQLVVVSPQEDTATVVLAEVVDGTFSVPLELPSGDAIAVYKSDNRYLPAGVFLAHEQVFVMLDRLPALEGYIAKVERPAPRPTVREETFYVLENAYQQLVFSNKGAALVEVNLPFESDDNVHSVVKSIEFDDKIVEQLPANGRFPLRPYYTPGGQSAGPFVEHSEGALGGYYPLLRRAVVDGEGRVVQEVPVQYRALNIVSQYPEVAELIYNLKAFDETSIVFEAVQPHRRITKTYRVEKQADGAPYVLTLDVRIEGDARGLWLTSGVPEVELVSGAAAPMLKYRFSRGDKGEVEDIGLPKDSTTVTSSHPDWICNSNGFLGMIVDPLTQINPGYMAKRVAGVVVPTRLAQIDRQLNQYKAADYPGFNILLPLQQQGGTMSFRIFAGPFASTTLRAVDAAFSDETTGYNPDYIACQSFHGWFTFISQPFAKFLFILMNFFHGVTGSWAGSIVLLTIALKMMLFPLNSWSFKSMRRMQQIAPEIQKIQERYKKEPKKAQLEIMGLYRSRGINPLSGCFPMLIQLPFLIGMFDLLKSTFELRGATFIPGWIDNLTAPDVLFTWGTPLPLIGNEFHLLPILLGASMFVQSRWMSPVPKTGELSEQQRQQKMMSTMMPILFTVLFYKFASGLNIYWLSSTIIGIGQQWLINRQVDRSDVDKTKEPVGRPAKGKRKRART